ncbi:MAG TPA: SLC13 family permease [Longimicrobiaceae bacterium]
MSELFPLVILLIGMVTVIGLIVGLRLNAFIALLIAAIVVSLLAPGDLAVKIGRVAEAFGTTAGSIGIVIALAAVIGKAMMDSGAADRIVRAFLSLLGEDRGGVALLSSGYVLGVPVFFDTVFYLLVPLARSMYRRTRKNYLLYIMAIGAGGAVTHTMVPPTPGPLVLAGTMGIDLGVMIVIGAMVGIPCAVAGLLYAGWMDRQMPVHLTGDEAGVPQPDYAPEPTLPGLFPSLLPILLPVVLISANTIVSTFVEIPGSSAFWTTVQPYTAVFGNSNFALLLSAFVAMWLYYDQRRPSLDEMATMTEDALMSGGVIILITAAGGAFGAMLREAQIGPAIQSLFEGNLAASPVMLILVSFALSSLLKTAQGSSTVAMITASAMMMAILGGTDQLSFHVVYLATAIASGSLVVSWMNDSGFWIYTKMGGLTVTQGLRSWTTLLVVLGFTGLLVTLVLAHFFPLV